MLAVKLTFLVSGLHVAEVVLMVTVLKNVCQFAAEVVPLKVMLRRWVLNPLVVTPDGSVPV